MNAIIFSAILGVVMMFTGIFTNKKKVITLTAIIALVVLLTVNLLNSYGLFSIQIDTKDLLHFNKLGLFFNTLIKKICYNKEQTGVLTGLLSVRYCCLFLRLQYYYQ